MEEQQKNNTKNKMMIIAAVAVVIILAIAVGGFLFMKTNEENSASEAMENEGAGKVQTQPSIEPTKSKPTSYKDGTYKAEGVYSYHAGTEAIGVTVTLKNGIIADVDVKQEAKAPMSKIMQADFAANYKTMVVGKKIDEVKLGKVSGSSLTPIGFNSALDLIKTQAAQSSS